MRDTEKEVRLWNEFINGNDQAFSDIYQAYFSSLYHYGFRIHNDDTFIEDCLHDFFLYLYNKRDNLSPVKSLQAYMFRSFRRAVLRKLSRYRKGMENDHSFIEESSRSDIPFEALMIEEENQSESLRILKKHLEALPPRQKEILYLKFFDNFSYEEIADITALSYQTVVNHLNKALKKLRKFYQLVGSIAASLFFLFISI